MKKKITLSSILVLVIFIFGFNTTENEITNETSIQTTYIKSISTVLTEEESKFDLSVPYIGKSYTGFKEAVGFKESQGNYNIISSFGYLGKYQFGRTTLERFKIYNTNSFLSNPSLQEKTFDALCSVNKWILRKDIKRSVGKRINGVLITESGILAAAHLGGAGNVKKYLRSNGTITFKDGFGTSLQYYIKKFKGYNTSIIEANRKPTII